VEAERVETGITLRVTPQINEETGEITMVILPSVRNATISDFQQTVQQTTYNFKDPEERTTKSIVKVKDGETVIIGGLITHTESELDTKVPFFGELPIVGSLFRHKNADRNKDRELLVFITPHLIKDSDTKLAQMPRKTSMPRREQVAATGMARREVEISSALSSFEK
jgi:type II secretory pathway component GspD/PulD (secretin)